MVNKKVYRNLSLLLFCVLSMGLLSGCGSRLPDGYNEDEVKAAAENVITLLNQRDLDGLTTILNAEMKEGLTEEVQAQIIAVLDEVGPVLAIGEMTTAGTAYNDSTYAVVVTIVTHENREITYTISFDPDMKLAGLYLQ